MKALPSNFLHNHPELEAHVNSIDTLFGSDTHVVVDRKDWEMARSILFALELVMDKCPICECTIPTKSP